MSRRRRRGAVALAAVLALAGAGCSDDAADGGADDEDSTAETATTLVPSSSGDRCDDPTGDLDVPPGVPDDLVDSLGGIDLVAASALVDGEVLVVDFEVAGPVADVAEPTFVVAQGDPLGSLSFELRLTGAGDGWESLLVTWPSGREQRHDGALAVRVEDNRVSTEIPLAELPPIARSMQFGAAATLPDGLIVIDDCTSLGSG